MVQRYSVANLTVATASVAALLLCLAVVQLNNTLPRELFQKNAQTQALLMPRRFTKDANKVVLPDAGVVGTDKAFIGKGDGSGQSTKAATQSLMMPQRFQKNPNVLPEAGEIGTDKAFIGKGDGSQQSTKATITQSLMMPKRFQKNPNVLPDAGVMGTDKAFVGKADGSGQSTKAKVQSLMMPKRFQTAGMSKTQANVLNAEQAAGLGNFVASQHPARPHAIAANTQALLQPSRFRKPMTESQEVHYEVSRAIGAQRPRSTGSSMEEVKSESRQRAAEARAFKRHQDESLHHAEQQVRRYQRGQPTADAAARTQQLSQQYLEFGRKARSFYEKHGLMSKQEAEWADHLASGGEKAPVTMLAETSALPCGRGGPCLAVPQWNAAHGITSKKEVEWSKHMSVESAADKAARTSQLAMSDDFDPLSQGDDNYATGVSSLIHRQSPGVNDQSGFPVTGMLKAKTQQLLMPRRFTPEGQAADWPLLGKDAARGGYVRVPDAFGSLGTAAEPSDPVFQAKVARGVEQLKQVFPTGNGVARDVTNYLFKSSAAAGL